MTGQQDKPAKLNPDKPIPMTIKRHWREERQQKPDAWHTSEEDKRQVALRRKIED